MKYLGLLIAIMIHGCACTGVMAFTDGKRLEFNQASGVDYKENFMINTDFETNIVTGLSGVLGGTKSHESSSVYFGIGKKYLKWTPSAQGHSISFLIKSLPGGLKNTDEQCAFTMLYRSEAISENPSATAKIEILTATSDVLGSAELQTYTQEKGIQLREIPVKCSDGATFARITWTGTVFTSLNFDELSFRHFKGWAGIVPEPQIFSAVLSAASPSVPQRETGNWIDGNCSYSGGLKTCDFTSGFFGGTVPNCTFSIAQTGDGFIAQNSATTSGFTVRTNSSGGTATNFAVTVSCQRVPGDPKYQEKTVVDAYGLVPGETVFSATFSSAGVVSDATENFITANASISDTSSYTITFATNHFNGVAPKCFADLSVNNSGANEGATPFNITSSGMQVRTLSGGAKAATAFKVFCQRGGADYTRARSTYENVPFGKEITTRITGTCSSSSAISSQGTNNSSIATWVTGSTNISAGECTLQIAGGVFGSEAPTCVPGYRSAFPSNAIIVSVNPTGGGGGTIGLDCKTDASVDCTTYNYSIICMGKR